MAGKFWTGSYGAVALQEEADPAAFQVSGAEAFAAPIAGTTTLAASGKPRTIYLTIGDLGKTVELSFVHIPITLLDSLLDLVLADLTLSHRLTITDGYQTVDVQARPADKWYKRGDPDGDYMKDVVLTFITTGSGV